MITSGEELCAGIQKSKGSLLTLGKITMNSWPNPPPKNKKTA